MKKFRVLSDLHLDINRSIPLEIKDKDVFTVICGDIAGEPDIAAKWLKENIKNGVFVSGNHLPYNSLRTTVQDQREAISRVFSADSAVTYLDAECKTFFKEVDGILFIGTCMYSDMAIKSDINPNGSINRNYSIAVKKMNDYRFGIKFIEKSGPNGKPTLIPISPADYRSWFCHAFKLIDEKIAENEKLKDPKPVVLITHFPLIKDILLNSAYVEEDNLASYGSDYEDWIKKHPSIKCYCCGHAHLVTKQFKSYAIDHEDGSKCLVVSNTRGYCSRAHDTLFNPNTYVNVEEWKTEEDPEDPEEVERKKKAFKSYMALASCFF